MEDPRGADGVPPPPELPEVQTASAEEVVHGAPSPEELVERAEPAEQVVARQPSVEEILGEVPSAAEVVGEEPAPEEVVRRAEHRDTRGETPEPGEPTAL